MPLRKDKDRINYVSHTHDLEEWIRDFGNYLNTHSEKNIIRYPESFGSGYASVHQIEDGFTYRIVDYRLNTDFQFDRTPSETFYLIIYFYRYSNCEQLHLSINGRAVIDHQHDEYSSLLMTNSRAHQKLTLTKNTIVQGLTVQISEEWIKSRLTVSPKLNLKILRQKDVFQTLIKPISFSLLKDIFSKRIPSPVPELYVSSRVMQLLDIFFEDIFKNGLEANVLPVSTRDVQNILRVEEYLLQNYRSQFPSIFTLARLAYMSSTKLKQVFKRAFGMSLFEFFQKNRMERAKELLLSNIYSVTEVGKMLGYQNLSNFSKAFKKEFGYLPKDVFDGW